MQRVNLLPPQIISKIAAGEVIERPASVVKELLENSIDANADRIDITLEQSGNTLIKIQDNGKGIHKDDIEKAFLRHATSKINSVNDLFAIHSLGFRGEALYTIAAVSDVILRSRTEHDDTGWQIHIRGGKKIAFKPVAMKCGTEIEIKELFFNTPARRKFLKTPATEFKQILSTVLPHTLIHNNCYFSLTHTNNLSKKLILDLPPELSASNRIAMSLNVDPIHIVEFNHQIENRNVILNAFLGDSNIRRTSKDLQYIFVNNRPVVSRLLNYQINEMYRLLFPHEVYPFFVIFLDIPPEDVDANVHPSKKEIKIRNEYDLFLIIRSICENVLMTQTKAKQIKNSPFTMPNESIASNKKDYSHTQNISTPKNQTNQKKSYSVDNQKTFDSFKTYSVMEKNTPEYIAKATENLLVQVEEKVETKQINTLASKLNTAQYIGNFMKKYLLYESSASLIIIDQHAAQERITFESLKKQIEEEQIEIQNLLAPYILNLSPAETITWEENASELSKLGFSTSLWDNNNTVAIHAHPQLITNPENSVRNLLSGNPISKCDLNTIAKRACRRSVMAGDIVNQTGAENIRKNLLKSYDPFTCPHGRPTVIEVEESFLAKQFLRT